MRSTVIATVLGVLVAISAGDALAAPFAGTGHAGIGGKVDGLKARDQALERARKVALEAAIEQLGASDPTARKQVLAAPGTPFVTTRPDGTGLVHPVSGPGVGHQHAGGECRVVVEFQRELHGVVVPVGGGGAADHKPAVGHGVVVGGQRVGVNEGDRGVVPDEVVGHGDDGLLDRVGIGALGQHHVAVAGVLLPGGQLRAFAAAGMLEGAGERRNRSGGPSPLYVAAVGSEAEAIALCGAEDAQAFLADRRAVVWADNGALANKRAAAMFGPNEERRAERLAADKAERARRTADRADRRQAGPGASVLGAGRKAAPDLSLIHI